MNEIKYNPIGTIHSPFRDIKGMPIQSVGAKGVMGTVEINPEYADGLKDLDGFSHIILIYHLHLSEGFSLMVKPFMDDNLRGVFATRAPRRPNSIGISVVKLVQIENNILQIEEVDIIDNTPLLDIKPYVPDFDNRNAERIGWLSGKSGRANELKSDDRFR